MEYSEWKDRGRLGRRIYIYVGARGSSVIDYVVVNEKTDDKVIEFKIDVRVDSDLMPMSVKIEKIRRGAGKRKRKIKQKNRRKK